jgi:hypothetical protein
MNKELTKEALNCALNIAIAFGIGVLLAAAWLS